jgi:hypothetical protein
MEGNKIVIKGILCKPGFGIPFDVAGNPIPYII